jgi:hypothetical protein
MRWLALVTWVVVLLIVLPASRTTLPNLGLLVIVTIAGLGTMIAFAVTGADGWAWLSFGIACVATVLAAVGARTLVYDEAHVLQRVSDHVKSTAALALGFSLPLLGAAVLITLGTAVP